MRQEIEILVFRKKVEIAETSIPHLTKDDQSFSRTHPVFWLKCFLRILHFLNLINHFPLHHWPHALCLKSTYEHGKLKECSQISMLKSLLDQMVFPLES